MATQTPAPVPATTRARPPAAPQLLAEDTLATATADAQATMQRATRWSLWALGLGFGGFVLWASLAPLDEGVPASALVSIDTKRKAVQHLSGGIVQQVLVREGDLVKEGQTVVRLDDAVAKANHQAIRQRYLGMRAMQSRLLAEEAGSSRIQFHPDLLRERGDPLVLQHTGTQQQLLESRQAALRSDLQGIEETLQGQQGMLKSFHGIEQDRRHQLALLQEELANTRALVKDGYAPRNRQLELERMVSDINAALTDLQGNTVRTQRSVAELRQRAISRQQEYRKEVQSQLADVEREVQADADKLKAAQDELGRIDIKSPADGQVIALAFQTVGSVVAPGQKLMDVVPPDEALVLEAQVPPHMIDRVHTGMPVDVRFSGFAHTPQLVVQGQVASVSADNLTVPQTGASYYLARVVVTPEGLKDLGQREMRPGMPAEVVFVTGERTLLNYLLRPLVRRVAGAMKEE